MRATRCSTPLYWFAALGVTCIASVLVRRRPQRLTLPERISRCADEVQLQAFA